MTTEEVKRKLAAILSADVKGYSRLMGEDEKGTVRTLNAYKEVMTGLIQHHHGRVVDAPGDNVLAEFASVVDAVECAVEIQKELKARNVELPENRRMEFRIGVNLGDVIEDGEQILGDGVNIAARLESLSDAGGICISGTAFDHVRNKVNFGYVYLGERTVKNIALPVRVYKVLLEPSLAGKVIGEKKAKPRQWQRPVSILVAILIVVVAVGVIWRLYLHPTRPPVEVASQEKMAFPLPNKPSIAVLPFVNMSEDPKQEYFSDGITEEIITALSKVPRLFVIARNSTFTYKGKAVKVRQVSEELGVRYVLEGSVRRAGGKVRITAQLIDALSGHHLWAERYDRDLKDIFTLQDEITLKIINALQVKLTESEQIIMLGKSTNNLEAYLKLLQAREYSNPMTREGNLLHRQMAEEAIVLDPRCAVAYLILSATHLRDLFFGWSESPEQSLRLAEELVKKAFAFDDSLGMAHAYLGRIYLTKKQHDEAIAEGERAIALSPNDDFVQAAFAITLYYSGRIEEAMVLYKKAIRLNPFPPVWYLWGLGSCYRDMGRHEGAIGEFRKALRLYPDSLLPHLGLAGTYSLMGREQEAHAETAEILRIDPKFSLNRQAKGFLFFKNQNDADRYIESLRKAGLK
jgi:adenylate cyclase